MNSLNYNENTIKISKEIADKCVRCKKCMNECLMLSSLNRSPQDIFKSFLESNSIEPIIPYSCSLCGRCSMVCPEKLEIPKAFMGMRESMAAACGGKSPLKGHKAVEMHQMLSFGFLNIFTTRRK
jgi:glutamate synthase (NADPH) small chain